MAKSQKYTEEQLLDAVVRFAEVEKRKIKATELAKWSRENIDGLEEVRDYHFTRSLKEKDEKTGEMIERQKVCTIRMEEINKARSLAGSIQANPLLSGADIDELLNQPGTVQSKMIMETRETVDKLLARNIRITRENGALRNENAELKNDLSLLAEKVEALRKAQVKLAKQVTFFMKASDEAARKEMLAKMGITDEAVDLNVYVKSLQERVDEVMDINDVLRSHYLELEQYKSDKSSMINEEQIYE